MADQLMGFYRIAEAHNPHVYLAGVVAVLSDYPVEIQRSVCDPRNGIPSKIKWLPTIAEIKSACEERYSAIRYGEDWDRRAQKKVASRGALAIPDYRAKTTPNKQYTYAEAEAWSKAKGDKQFRPVGRFEERAEFKRDEQPSAPQPLESLPDASDALLKTLQEHAA